jgi:hypothetical protein
VEDEARCLRLQSPSHVLEVQQCRGRPRPGNEARMLSTSTQHQPTDKRVTRQACYQGVSHQIGWTQGGMTDFYQEFIQHSRSHERYSLFHTDGAMVLAFQRANTLRYPR